MAHYKAKAGDLHGSAQLFEKEGEKALQNTLLQCARGLPHRPRRGEGVGP